MSDHTPSYKTRSHASCTSCHSNVSSTGSGTARARAKAEAAKARLSFAEKEMPLKLERAKIEASIELLNCERDAATAVAEAEALEAAIDSQSVIHSCEHSPDPTFPETAQRTKQYVLDQIKTMQIQKAATAGEPYTPGEAPSISEQRRNNNTHSLQTDKGNSCPSSELSCIHESAVSFQNTLAANPSHTSPY